MSLPRPIRIAAQLTQFTLGFGGPAWDVDTGAPWLAWRDRMNAMAVA